MSLDQIQQLANSLVKSLENNEKVSTQLLASKLAKCIVEHPHDQTIGAMSRVINKMADNNTLFIKRADLKDLYHRLHSRNTKFAELFSNELGTMQELPSAKVYQRDNGQEIGQYQVEDTVLANALSSVFDNTLPVKAYSQSLADKAISSVNNALDAFDMKPNHLQTVAGNDKFLITKADYETPKGITSFYVPVEINGGKLSQPSVFMGNAGVSELNHNDVKSYLTSHTGTKLLVNADAMMEVLNKATSENRQVSDTELALTRLNASRQEQGDFLQGQITGQKMAEASVKDVELPKSDEFSSFEQKFTSPYGAASFQFGEDKVKTARDCVARELIGFGCKSPQVVITGSDSNTMFYSVSLDGGKVAFTVPVKVSGGKIVAPAVMLCNGSVAPFVKESVNELYVNNQSDFKAAAAASPLFGVKPSDLINSVRAAVAEGNHAKAEDALNVLANSGDSKAYATGFQAFLSGLSGKKEEPSKCSMQLKTASSQHLVCGHTGLPLHKVYQDKHGNCRPGYRREMDETYQGASFMNAKIFG